MEVQQESDYDPDQNSNNSFEIVLDSPVGKRQHQSEFTSTESKKEVVEETARSTINFLTWNVHIPAAYLREFRALKVEEEHPVHPQNYLSKGQSDVAAVMHRIRKSLSTEVEGLDARCSDQVVVARVIPSGKESANDFIVEIEDEKNQEKLDIGDELLWTGMISAMRVEWKSEYYMLRQKVHPLSDEQRPKHIDIANNPRSTKIVIAKGPYSPSNALDFSCLSILSECLKRNQPDMLILLGPFITKHNLSHLTDFSDHSLKKLLMEVQNQLPNTQVVVVPSTHDVCSRFPIPQPAFAYKDCGKAMMVSNPSTLSLAADGQSVCRLSLVNTDIIMGIEKNLRKKVQKPKQLHRQMCEAYARQPMMVTATHETLDESNMEQLYNGGNHGDFIVYASEEKASMVERVGRHLFLGVAHLLKPKDKIGYFTEVTIYEGGGNVLDRTRVDVRKISY